MVVVCAGTEPKRLSRNGLETCEEAGRKRPRVWENPSVLAAICFRQIRTNDHRRPPDSGVRTGTPSCHRGNMRGDLK
jgi:hypothetical protein